MSAKIYNFYAEQAKRKKLRPEWYIEDLEYSVGPQGDFEHFLMTVKFNYEDNGDK